MKVKLRFFAAWREIVGQSELSWPIQPDQNVETLLAGVIAEYPKLAGAAKSSLVMVNRKYADKQAALQDGDEVAFIPPVGGGAS